MLAQRQRELLTKFSCDHIMLQQESMFDARNFAVQKVKLLFRKKMSVQDKKCMKYSACSSRE